MADYTDIDKLREQAEQHRHDGLCSVNCDPDARAQMLERVAAVSSTDGTDEQCRHDSSTGDEGPDIRHVVRWRCDGCGAIHYDDDSLAAVRAELVGLRTEVDRLASIKLALIRERDAAVAWAVRVEQERDEARTEVDQLRTDVAEVLAWSMKNEIAQPPLDWAALGAILREAGVTP